MSQSIYVDVFNEFKKELEEYAIVIFSHPLPFTQVNKLAMLAAMVAERCVDKRKYEEDMAESHGTSPTG